MVEEEGSHRSNHFAPESEKTRKLREKLKEQLEQEAGQITPVALAATVEKIHHWISLNASQRIVLKDKSIRLFDQNQNAAALSRKVQDIANAIRNI